MVRHLSCFMVLILANYSLLVAKENFFPYKQNYILLTSYHKPSEVKFQFSIKYNIVDSTGFYFAFTQKSFWNMWDFALSSPFTESNFNPEFYYDFFTNKPCGALQHFMFGVEHESNGKDKSQSRSWNRVSVQAEEKANNWLRLRQKFWIPFVVAEENSNIQESNGYGELAFEIVHPQYPEKFSLNIEIRKGARTELRYSALQVGLTLKLIALFFQDDPSFNPSFYAQYWNDMGENLMLYDVPTKNVRIGIAIE